MIKSAEMTFNFLSKAHLNAEFFQDSRKYFYLIVLIIGACFTDSPNGKEQLIIAVPLMLVFEWTILLLNNYKK